MVPPPCAFIRPMSSPLQLGDVHNNHTNHSFLSPTIVVGVVGVVGVVVVVAASFFPSRRLRGPFSLGVFCFELHSRIRSEADVSNSIYGLAIPAFVEMKFFPSHLKL